MKLQTHPIFALLIAALVPVAAGTIIAPPYGPDWWAALPLAGVVYLFSIMFTMTLGLPPLALLYGLGWARWWSALIAGLLGGAAIGAGVWKPYGSAAIDIPIMALTGAMTGLLFWSLLGARYRRTIERQEETPPLI